jgi:hypothetical protein
MLERGATKRLAACYKRLERANNRLELLSEPCRTAIIVDTSIGIIVNGGFNYFFEMDFPDNPEYGLFTDAFRHVGLTEIADRFAELVAAFPFDAPHAALALREQFMGNRPAEFDDAMTQLENLIYSSWGDSATVLERYLEGSDPPIGR